MSILSAHNLYPGINAHLNSYLQAERGGWRSFHAEHIIDLARVINEKLPTGYFTRPEMSLQIDEVEAFSGFKQAGYTIPDTMIYQGRSLPRSGVDDTPMVAVPVMELPLIETVDEEDTLTGLMIYRMGGINEDERPVTRVELLSPANKPGGSHFDQYLAKRISTLKAGLRLVEIDYLHETRPVTRRQPSYKDYHQGASPYMILIHKPYPTFEAGLTQFYPIAVDEPLPHIAIPLLGADRVIANLGEAYRRTYENSTYYPIRMDYTTEPINFDRYHADDQVRIRAVLAQIRSQHIQTG
jgi:hypothetical protein